MSNETKSDAEFLVELMRIGLEPLVRDRLIPTLKANNRASNLATIVLGHFELKRISTEDETLAEQLDRAEERLTAAQEEVERILLEVVEECATAKKPKYEEVWCSSCGESQGPGDCGYSHCEDHETAAECAPGKAQP